MADFAWFLKHINDLLERLDLTGRAKTKRLQSLDKVFALQLFDLNDLALL
jgi:hypothetical protein